MENMDTLYSIPSGYLYNNSLSVICQYLILIERRNPHFRKTLILRIYCLKQNIKQNKLKSILLIISQNYRGFAKLRGCGCFGVGQGEK